MTTQQTLVLVGTGAYVTEDTYGPGVIARSLAQWCDGNGGASRWRLVILVRSEEGRQRIAETWSAIRSEIDSVPEPILIYSGSEAASKEIRNAHALFVCVPDQAHAEYLKYGLAAGVPTWIVKPMTGVAGPSAMIAQAAERRGVPVWVDYHKRFDVSNRVLRSTAMNEEHGAPLLYSVRYSQPRALPLEQFSWAAETDVFSYIGCHYVDQLMFVFPGIEILRANATGIAGPVFERFGGLAFDTVLARLDGEWRGRPLTAQFEVGWANPLGSPTKSLQIVECAFERAKIFLDQTHRGFETWTDRSVAVPNPYFFSRILDPLTGRDAYQGYGYDSIRNFLDFTIASREERTRALANDALPWARSAARTDAVVELVRESLMRSSSVPLAGKHTAGSTD